MAIYVYTDKFIREPGADTVAYYPLNSTSTVNDMSGNNNTLTNSGGVTFGTNQGVDCALFDGVDTALTNNNISFGPYPVFTTQGRCYIEGINTNIYQETFSLGSVRKFGHLSSWFKYNTGLAISSGSDQGGYESIKSGNINGSWHLITNVVNGSSSVQYLDGEYYQQFTNSLSQNLNGFSLGVAGIPEDMSTTRLLGCLSECIVESKARTAQEVADYFNGTKSNYGIS